MGDGSVLDRLTPNRLPVGLRFTTLSAGFEHTCGLEASGAAYCWGSNRTGELGNGTVAESETPVLVAGNLVFASIAAAGDEYDFAGERIFDNGHTCGVTVDGTVYCWGYNRFGELGDNSADAKNPNPFKPFPVKVAGQR